VPGNSPELAQPISDGIAAISDHSSSVGRSVHARLPPAHPFVCLLCYVNRICSSALERREMELGGHLLRLLRNPALEPDLLRFTSWNHWAEHLKRVCLHGINVLDLATQCTHDCDPQASDCDVSSQTWCTRKNLCVPQNWQFRHATRILDVIMLDYPVQVRPMPGMWVQSVPVTAIPWGRMKTEQRNLVTRSIRKHD
jgi:hypothetical protein